MFSNVERVISFLTNGTNKCRIAVIGDVMLDRYYDGDVGRISPEAPVPVVKIGGTRETLGGAANVAHNMALLGCEVFLAGAAGQDDARRRLCHLLDATRIDYAGLIVCARPTTTKVRVIGSHQQMIRLDFEQTGRVDEASEQQLQWWFSEKLKKGVDGVAISDYNKGVCTPGLCRFIIDTCNKRKIPVVVDPKGLDWEKYSGATFVAPNVKELSQAAGKQILNEDKFIELHAKETGERFKLANIVVTRSEKGLSLVNSSHVIHVPTEAREVFDVSGAGDAVTAVLTAAITGGLDYVDAARLANLAGGIVVGKVGTYATSNIELLEGIWNIVGGSRWSRKIMSLGETRSLVERWRAEKKVIVFTNGCFDILHAGHLTYLQKARGFGDHLIIGLNTDTSVRKIKGPDRPIVSEMDRARMLAALEFVDCVVFFDEELPSSLIREIRPDVLVKGGDYFHETVAGREYAGQVKIVPLLEGYSTSAIIESIVKKHNNREGTGS